MAKKRFNPIYARSGYQFRNLKALLNQGAEAGHRFFLELIRHRPINLPPLTVGELQQIDRLCMSAFQLYQLDWKGHDVINWRWPFTELAVASPFEDHGLEPWNILLRTAHQMTMH